jgi:fused signal recognition particle receptor
MALGWFRKDKKSGGEKPAPEAPTVESTGDAGTEALSGGGRPPSPPAPTAESLPVEPGGLLKRLQRGLTKTRRLLTTDIDDLFAGKNALDDDLLEDLEEILITADIGVQTATSLMGRVSQKSGGIRDAAALKSVLKDEILALLRGQPAVPVASTAKPHVIMVVGVNGVGKTTTIGKLAAKYAAAGKKVLVAAADTFRAAAAEQLAIWAERAGADLVRHKDGADPAAVAYDGMEAAFARDADVVLVDTAGRLHTKVNLMEELKKIKRSIQKKMPDAPQEILLVLDATTGQNALSQARLFNEALDITGLALTKLDGTAKGGIVVSIYTALNIPLKYIGVGEDLDDLQDFDAEQFVGALF